VTGNSTTEAGMTTLIERIVVDLGDKRAGAEVGATRG
jgi:hypothetical protein